MIELVGSFVRLFTGVQARWLELAPAEKQCIYFANHTSHFDFMVLWSVLPPNSRKNTTAAAAADYWTRNGFNCWLANNVFKVVLIDRDHVTRANNPIAKLVAVLDQGQSLIIFPEGGRSVDEELHDFKGGIYHLAKARPEIDLVPCFIDNANRVLPKGEFLPIPLICSVTFGKSMRIEANESKEPFLSRAQLAIKECAQQ